MTLVLVMGTADWNQAIATNQHYAVREIAREHEVIFVESTGLRTPEFRLRDLRRIAARLLKVLSNRRTSGYSRPIPSGVQVVSPLVIPWHKTSVRKLNRWLIRRAVSAWLDYPDEKVLWTYTPVTYGLETEAPTLYHCVDLLHEQSGIDPTVVFAGEAALAASGARVAASSRAVETHVKQIGFSDVTYWPNVADVEVFNTSPESGRSVRAVFAGNLTASKVDFDLLIALAKAGVDVAVAGPLAEGGGSTRSDLDRLLNSGVRYHGQLSLTELADLLGTSSIGLIPYRLNRYTAGVNPLKTFEYLAAGLAVVSTAIAAVEQDGVDVFVEQGGDFVERVKLLSKQPDDQDVRRRRATAANHGWLQRGESMRDLLGRMVEK